MAAMPTKRWSTNFSPSSLASAPRSTRCERCGLLVVALIICGCHSSQQAAVAPVSKPVARDPRYPAHWWAPVSDAKKPGWEILPQEALPGEVILSKRHELGLLSNFAPTPFEFHGKRYASLEGFWQAMKYPEGPDDPRSQFPGLEWKYTRDEVAQMTAFAAKAAGDLGSRNMKTMGIDWVMFEGRQMPYRPGKGPEDKGPSARSGEGEEVATLLRLDGDAAGASDQSQKTADPDPTKGEHYRLVVEATREKVRQNPEVERVLMSTGDLVLKPDHHQEPDAPAAWRYYEILSDIRRELQQRP
jgi:predicted NAD-dependent protein-ADP-ribosyltransferase YbiA (DUF1768 family)